MFHAEQVHQDSNNNHHATPGGEGSFEKKKNETKHTVKTAFGWGMLSAFRICSPMVSGTKNGGTVPYKAILPCISLTNSLPLVSPSILGT